MKIFLVLGFLAAQAVNWTDCGEGLFCASKQTCASDCKDDGCAPCEDKTCAHLEPQWDVISDVPPAPEVPDFTPVALVESTVASPAFVVPPDVPVDGLPPPYITQHAFLS